MDYNLHFVTEIRVILPLIFVYKNRLYFNRVSFLAAFKFKTSFLLRSALFRDKHKWRLIFIKAMSTIVALYSVFIFKKSIMQIIQQAKIQLLKIRNHWALFPQLLSCSLSTVINVWAPHVLQGTCEHFAPLLGNLWILLILQGTSEHFAPLLGNLWILRILQGTSEHFAPLIRNLWAICTFYKKLMSTM